MTGALTNWQALYRYVVSINVVLPHSGSKRKEILKDLTTLVQYGGNYVGTMRREIEGIDDPETITWDELVERTTEPFGKSYTNRGILHGNLPLEDLSDDETHEIRILAHNAIRLMAVLQRKFNWKNDKEAIAWFKNP